jgi:PncC family amidohydrolase
VAEREVTGSSADDLARAAVRLLAARGLWVATAESLTGGLLAAAVTDVPGASRVFRGGVVAYATDLKHELLGVDADLLARVGAVDPAVAVEMARGARHRLGADLAIATTGVAGPDPQDGQPPGTVFVGLAEAGRAWPVDVSVRGGDVGTRAQVRAHTVHAALQVLVDHLGR